MELDNGLSLLELGAVADAYLQQYLAHRLSLSQALLARLDFRRGSCSAVVPDGTSVDRASELERGGLVDSHLTLSAQIELTRDYLHSQAGHLVVFEDSLARRGDPILEQSPTKMTTYTDEVYHFLDHSDAKLYPIETTMSWQTSASGQVAVFTSPPPDASLQVGAATTAEHLSVLAAHADHVLVDAYDCESFVIWRRLGAQMAA